mgnify:CR=1 FL=1
MKITGFIDHGLSFNPKNEVRIIAELNNGRTVEVVCTHEGIIINAVCDGEIIDGSFWKLWEEIFEMASNGSTDSAE